MPTPTVLKQCQDALRELVQPLRRQRVPTTPPAADFRPLECPRAGVVQKARWKNWKTFGFATVADQAAYPLPADWAGPIDQTEWDRTNHWSLIGQATPQQWQTLQSGIVALGPRLRYRYINDTIEIFPTPTTVNGVFAAYDLAFEYYASGWVIDANTGTTKNEATSDADAACIESAHGERHQAEAVGDQGLRHLGVTRLRRLVQSGHVAQPRSAEAVVVAACESDIYRPLEYKDKNWNTGPAGLT
jgi:hypothetical protein